MTPAIFRSSVRCCHTTQTVRNAPSAIIRVSFNRLSATNQCPARYSLSLSMHWPSVASISYNIKFIFYTDHASLRPPVNTLHISQRMVKVFYFFAKYNFSVKYKPGRLNVVIKDLLRWSHLDPAASSNSDNIPTVVTLSSSAPSSNLLINMRKAYAQDKSLVCF